jgi:DNA-binding NtrC family response regulator
MRPTDAAEDTRALVAGPSSEALAPGRLAGLRFIVVAGPDKGRSVLCDAARVTVGTETGNDLVLTDPTVSRKHCELTSTAAGFLLRDLRSTNGLRLGGCRVESVYIRPGTTLRLGNSVLSFEAHPEAEMATRAGRPLGRSAAMRQIFSMLARVSLYDATVLLEGETGTGKSLLARTIHKASPRAREPFIVVDCGAIPPSLIESELFGHERGAFTGAHATHIGSFESARGGTLFLDEIGELPLDMQPKLLRAIEDRVIKRIGSSESIRLDLRLVAATNRDLGDAVKEGTFRSDLFYRLNTVSVRVPPLRDRPEDIPLLATYFYQESTGDPEATLPDVLVEDLVKHQWPGNARELRSAVERLVVLGDAWPQTAGPHTPPLSDTQKIMDGDPEALLSFREAKERAIGQWEQEYVGKLLRRTGGNLSQAAREVRMDRNYLRDLVRRRGLTVAGNSGADKP